MKLYIVESKRLPKLTIIAEDITDCIYLYSQYLGINSIEYKQVDNHFWKVIYQNFSATFQEFEFTRGIVG